MIKRWATSLRYLKDLIKALLQIGASVPRLFWWYCNPLDARYLSCFETHDYLYSMGYDRKLADEKLRKDLIEKRDE